MGSNLRKDIEFHKKGRNHFWDVCSTELEDLKIKSFGSFSSVCLLDHQDLKLNFMTLVRAMHSFSEPVLLCFEVLLCEFWSEASEIPLKYCNDPKRYRLGKGVNRSINFQILKLFQITILEWNKYFQKSMNKNFLISA